MWSSQLIWCQSYLQWDSAHHLKRGRRQGDRLCKKTLVLRLSLLPVACRCMSSIYRSAKYFYARLVYLAQSSLESLCAVYGYPRNWWNCLCSRKGHHCPHCKDLGDRSTCSPVLSFTNHRLGLGTSLCSKGLVSEGMTASYREALPWILIWKFLLRREVNFERGRSRALWAANATWCLLLAWGRLGNFCPS